MSSRLLGVSNARCCGNVSPEPNQLGSKIIELLFDIFRLLGALGLVVQNNHALDQYLMVFDQRSHAAEDGLEGREPVR